MNKLLHLVYQSEAIKTTCKCMAGDDWEDLLHDVIIKLSTKDLESIHAKGHILAYANRTAYHMAIERHRKAAREQVEQDEHEPDESPTADDYKDRIALLKQGNRREKILAMVVELVLEHGSVKAVSIATGVPIRTINNYLNEFRKAANTRTI